MTRSKRNTKLTLDDIGGKVVKDNETYLLKDNTTLNNLVVSSTNLNPFKRTTGHSHAGQEEVYIFVKGSGVMKIDDDMFPVKEGDTILKYGHDIGKVVTSIKKGDHVHVHNVKTKKW